METCSHCGASMSSGDTACPACGTPRAEDEPPGGGGDAAAADAVTSAEGDAVTSAEGDAVTSFEGDAVEAPSVPAGTWASTSQSEVPPPPEPPPPANPYDREATTGRVRRVRDEEPRVEARPVRTRASRSDAMVRARARGLAVAPAPAEEGEPEETPQKEAQVVAFPRSADRGGASSSGVRAPIPVEAPPAAPPKFLASEILRERIPAEPYGWTSRAIAAVGGVLGTAAALVVGPHPDLGNVAICASLAALAILPIAFSLRAGGFAVLASLGLVVATYARTGGGEGEAIGLATMGTTLLAAAQLLRATLRRSRFARAAMMVGLVVTGCWLALDGGLDAMVVRGEAIEAWLGPAMRATLMIVLALSLLGFVDETGRSGTHVWPWMVLVWSLLEAMVAIAVHGTDAVLATTMTPLYSAVAALGWMQVWATTPGLGVKEPARLARGDG